LNELIFRRGRFSGNIWCFSPPKISNWQEEGIFRAIWDIHGNIDS